MISERDLLLGRIAVNEHLVSQDQLDECISAQESDPEPRPLGEILLQKEYLTAEQLGSILAIQKARLEAKDEYTSLLRKDCLFGKLLIEMGMATEKQVHEALREQAKLEHEGIFRQLGQVMVQKGFITVAQAKQVLAEKDMHILACTGCKTKFNVTGYTPEKKLNCPKCGGPLMLPGVISTIGTEATLRSDGTTESLIGKEIGGCKIIEKVGRGGMATVYRGHHVGLNKLMAVKILPPESSTNRELIRRFITEARAAARLEHRNIVQVFDVGVDMNRVYILMQFIEGKGLEKLIAENEFIDVRESLRIIMEAARGVAVAHKVGIFHRDIKPDNILITKTGQVKVSDFGLAKSIRPLTAGEEGDILMGTPYYMSPEQVEGKGTDARSDIYSLGATFYMLLTRKKPFEGKNIYEIMKKHLSEPLRSPREHDSRLPEELCAIVMKMMEKNPAKRYRTVDELLEDLDRFRNGLTPKAAIKKGKPKKCPFCSELNDGAAAKCTACGTSLGEEGELTLMPFEDEINCPKCKEIIQKGTRRCPKCGVIICSTCQSRIATSTGICKACRQYGLKIAEPSPSFPSPKQPSPSPKKPLPSAKQPSPSPKKPPPAKSSAPPAAKTETASVASSSRPAPPAKPAPPPKLPPTRFRRLRGKPHS